MSQETWDLRVRVVCKVHLAQRGSLEDGAVLGVMEPEACLDKQAPRVTVALMAWLDCQERRATGVTLVLPAHLDSQEKMERGVTMEKLDPGDYLGSLDHVVCLDPKGLLALLALRV